MCVGDIKSRPDLALMPIIMISAHPNAYDEVKRAGADDFLAKPFGAGELLAKVKRVASFSARN